MPSGNAKTARAQVSDSGSFYSSYLLWSTEGPKPEGVANRLDGMFAVAVAAGDIQQACNLVGNSDEIRERRGLLGPAMLPYCDRVNAKVRVFPAARDFDIAPEHGRQADVEKVVGEALGSPRGTSSAARSRKSPFDGAFDFPHSRDWPKWAAQFEMLSLLR